MLFDLRRKKDIVHAVGILLLLAVPAFLSHHSKTQLQAIREGGELILITRNTPTTYYLDKGKPAGFEYDLAKAFADFVGVQLRVELAPSFKDIFTTIKARNAHIAGANLTVTPQRLEQFAFSPPYLETESAFIYRIKQGRQAPTSIEDIMDSDLVVLANSSHAETLEDLKKDHPQLAWQETEGESAVDLLEKVHNEDIEYTVMDTLTYESHSSYFPGVNKAFSLTSPMPLAWMYAPHPDNSLKQALERFFEREETTLLIGKLKEKYFGRENRLNFFDTITFRKHVQERLPALKPYFRQAEKETGIDWHLLAAIAYQESHWNHNAVSPTGVRGVMMLTQATASDLGVTDRTDPKQSILGGARYLKQTMGKIPERITTRDRVWFALASYNVGFGHLEDARILTERSGKNPDRWSDVKESLPLLTNPRYYNTVKYGYARGYEPVLYVKNIQRYLNLLRWETQLDQMRQTITILNSAKPDQDEELNNIVNQIPLTL
jgi:membrane-bound lytic murein transglycosylase F